MAYYDRDIGCTVDANPDSSVGNPYYRAFAKNKLIIGRSMSMNQNVDSTIYETIPIDNPFIQHLWILNSQVHLYTVDGEFIKVIGEKMTSSQLDETMFEVVSVSDEVDTWQVIDIYLICGKDITSNSYINRMELFCSNIATAIPLNLTLMSEKGGSYFYHPHKTIFERKLVISCKSDDSTPLSLKQKVVKEGLQDHFSINGELIAIKSINESRFLYKLFNGLSVGDFVYTPCSYNPMTKRWSVIVSN